MAIRTEYPSPRAALTRWIEQARSEAPEKNRLDPWKPYAFLEETEAGPGGRAIPTATVFLTNRECPYRCLMCDLWINTLDSTVPNGAIAAQIRYALDRLPGFRETRQVGAQIKLYNAGSFFDPGAIPPDDYPEIAQTVHGFGHVVVECHPALVGKRTIEFADALEGTLEVAIGLETAHAGTLERLNKRFTVDDFRKAAEFLSDNGIALRVFLLLRPPFTNEAEGLERAMRSLDVAFDAGTSVCCVIPTRGGNGAMERLAAGGDFAPPTLRSLESVLEYGIGLNRGRVFADLWDIESLKDCLCAESRIGRLEAMNRSQAVPPPIECLRCGATA